MWGHAVQVVSDNMTTVAYLNHLSGRDQTFLTLTRTIFCLVSSKQNLTVCSTSQWGKKPAGQFFVKGVVHTRVAAESLAVRHD